MENYQNDMQPYLKDFYNIDESCEIYYGNEEVD